MADEFDDFAKALQEQINEETREVYGQIAFERWLKPLHVGVLPNPEGYGRITGTCGDTMEIFLRFEDGRVKNATFQTSGCGPSLVCGSFAAEMAHGKSPDEVAEITGEMILDILGSLPEEKRHCAFLAAETLREALKDYIKNERGRDNSARLDDRRNPEPEHNEG
jgi:nitrogen fixation NifU-like protein